MLLPDIKFCSSFSEFPENLLQIQVFWKPISNSNDWCILCFVWTVAARDAACPRNTQEDLGEEV